MKRAAIFALFGLSIALQGCVVSFHVFADIDSLFGPRHHHSHATPVPVCPPKDKHCIDDSGMRP